MQSFVTILMCVLPAVADNDVSRLPCRIEVVEKGSGWPVPLVELRTTHDIRLVTDNAGVIAFDLPELMGREMWFDVIGHGYEVPKDGFGFRGVRLTPRPGKTLRVEVTRTIIAKRLGRLTGRGCSPRVRSWAATWTGASRASSAATACRRRRIAAGTSGSGATRRCRTIRSASSTGRARRRRFSRSNPSSRRCG